MMKLYKTRTGMVVESNDTFYEFSGYDWDKFINDDLLLSKMKKMIVNHPSGGHELVNNILAPIGSQQELWACGVTYLKSKTGRQEESNASGGADFYARVYDAERPEVFFKANPHRIAGHLASVRIREDSTWDVPEPELTLVVTASGKIVGYTIGNDMSSRSIEGENPLYLPQAKTYDDCASLGPCIYVSDGPLAATTRIRMDIHRHDQQVFTASVETGQMKRSPEELVSFVFRECSFPHGCCIMTGTGIVPPKSFTLRSGDEIKISIEGIGELVNKVGPVKSRRNKYQAIPE